MISLLVFLSVILLLSIFYLAYLMNRYNRMYGRKMSKYCSCGKFCTCNKDYCNCSSDCNCENCNCNK